MSRCLATLTLLILACTAAAAQDWEDKFEDPTLDARWTWRAPVEGPQASLTERPGWLRIRLPQRENGFNHWNQPVAVDEAPQLRTPAPPGDWELEARVQLQEFDRGSNFHAGLLIGLSDAQILVWGPFYGPGLPGGQQAPEVALEPTGVSGYARTQGDANDLTLRLTKVGRLCRAALRRADGDWVDGGIYMLPDNPRFIGLVGKTFFNGPGIVFDVDYVRLITRQDAAAPVPTPAPTAGELQPAAAPKEEPKPAPPSADRAPTPTPRTGGGGALESGGAAGARAAAPIEVTSQMIALARRLCDEGDRYLRQKRYLDAEACYRVVLLYLPESPRALAGLVRARAAQR